MNLAKITLWDEGDEWDDSGGKTYGKNDTTPPSDTIPPSYKKRGKRANQHVTAICL